MTLQFHLLNSLSKGRNQFKCLKLYKDLFADRTEPLFLCHVNVNTRNLTTTNKISKVTSIKRQRFTNPNYSWNNHQGNNSIYNNIKHVSNSTCVHSSQDTKETNNNYLHQKELTAEQEVLEFTTRETQICRNHLTPEIGLRLITPECRLWWSRAGEAEGLGKVGDPFWAFYWPGGQALTRYILDHPHMVSSCNVLDIGSGCGASAIACATAGAKTVIANDIDTVARTAIKQNALLNNVHVQVSSENYIGQDLNDDINVVLLGDMFYDDEFTYLVSDWLKQINTDERKILIGDPGRVSLLSHPMKKRLTLQHSYTLPKTTRDENNGLTDGYVWRYS